ncbi:conjugative transfer system coupling protein TraD [Enterobacter asburiae]|nr:conjugative transfer system coupling protein TraD [Enterobacter asburiae]
MAKTKRTNLHAQENLYRPVLEYRSATILLVCALVTLIQGYQSDGSTPAPIVLIMATSLFLLCVWRCYAATPFFKAHWRIFKRQFLFISLDQLRMINKSDFFANERKFRMLTEEYAKANKAMPERKTYLCDGYPWGPEHADRAYQINNLSSDLREIALPFVLKPITRHFASLARNMGGSNALFAVDEREPTFVTESNWFGHTLITGNVGTGKTVLLRLLSASMLHMGHVVVFLDPKNDTDCREGLKKEAEHLGLPFYQFHPGRPSSSVCIDVCNSFVNVSDLTSRILSLVSESGKVDPFVQYAESLISTIISGLRLIDTKPSIKLIYRNMMNQQAIINLTVKALENAYAKFYGLDQWIEKVKYTPNEPLSQRAKRLFEWYVAHFMNYEGVEKLEWLDTVAKLIDYSTSSAEHMGKMTAGIMPLFSRLTESPLDELLSPTDSTNHGREVVTSDGIFNSGGVLYIALDGLSNPKTARDISQLIMSDLTACAGSRYNSGDGDLSGHSRISIFVDEAHSAINNSMINLLAQGRAAKIALFICTQTISDFIASANAETANRITGLCNNYISLRINDNPTQTLVVENFGKSPISTNMVSYSTGTGTTLSHNDFSGSISERKQTTLEESIPKELMGQVPNLHIVARLQDGRKIVGQIPIAVSESAMKPSTRLVEMIIKSPRKVTLRKNLNIAEISKYLRKTH